MSAAVSVDPPVIFCLVPEAYEQDLLDPLREHFASDARVRVIVDRRVRDRRSTAAETPAPEREKDRRRPADRRRPVLPRFTFELPSGLEEHRDTVRFVQRLPAVTDTLQGIDDDVLVRRVQAGDPEACAELFWRCSARVHSRLSVLLGDAGLAEAAVARTFGRVLDAIDAAGDPPPPFQRLLYEAVDVATPDDVDLEDEDELPEFVATLETASLIVWDPLLDEPVTIGSADPRWADRAISERDALLRRAGGDLVAVEHIGSTAVPGLPGRPIVDLLVGVEGLPVPPALEAALLDRGYEACGDAGAPGRAFYRRRGRMNFDVHVVEHGGPLWAAPLALRDHLRADPADCRRWAVARQEAARRADSSLLRYCELRAPALAGILAAVGGQTAQRAG